MTSDSPSASGLKRFLLDGQREDAKRRLADTGYWGDTGLWVSLAVQKAEEAIDSIPLVPGTPVKTWVEMVDTALEEAHETFRREEDDPDGYGSATFHEIRKMLTEIVQ